MGVFLPGQFGLLRRPARALGLGFFPQAVTSAGEQASGMSEINDAVAQLDQTTRSNVAMFEETTAATSVLDSEARRRAEIVDRLSIPAGHAMPASAPGTAEAA